MSHRRSPRLLYAKHLRLAREQAEPETAPRVEAASDLQAALYEAELEIAVLPPEYTGLERRARAVTLLYEVFAQRRNL